MIYLIRYGKELDEQLQVIQIQRNRVFDQFLEEKKLIDQIIDRIQRENQEKILRRIQDKQEKQESEPLRKLLLKLFFLLLDLQIMLSILFFKFPTKSNISKKNQCIWRTCNPQKWREWGTRIKTFFQVILNLAKNMINQVVWIWQYQEPETNKCRKSRRQK